MRKYRTYPEDPLFFQKTHGTIYNQFGLKVRYSRGAPNLPKVEWFDPWNCLSIRTRRATIDGGGDTLGSGVRCCGGRRVTSGLGRRTDSSGFRTRPWAGRAKMSSQYTVFA